MEEFVESNKLLVALVCSMAMVSTISVYLVIGKIERDHPELLLAVGITKVDFGLRCYRGFALLGFSSHGGNLAAWQRFAFRSLFFTYGLFLLIGIIGIGRTG